MGAHAQVSKRDEGVIAHMLLCHMICDGLIVVQGAWQQQYNPEACELRECCPEARPHVSANNLCRDKGHMLSEKVE